MRYLLIVLAGCLISCGGSDRYDVVAYLERDLPGANAEHVAEDIFIVSQNNKSVIVNKGKFDIMIKSINKEPEEIFYVISSDEKVGKWESMIKELQKRLENEVKVENEN